MVSKCKTDRLTLIAATPDHLIAELKSPNELTALLDAKVTSEWPPGEYDRAAQEYFLDRMTEGGEEVIGWYGWYAVTNDEKNDPPFLIAAAGYFGPPSEKGEVEIGYSVTPYFRNRGYATEIVKALVDLAFSDIRVKRIIAHTGKENRSSAAVLENSGFYFVSESGEEENLLYEIIRK
jgi:[ribosomal protein S5]-alanine N-acetyltransferase